MEGFFMMRAEEEMKKALYDEANGKMISIMTELEKATGMKREDISHAGGVCIALYLIFGDMAGLLCNMIGFAYPAYASILAIETKTTTDDTQWLTYWTVFALFSMADFFSKELMDLVPLYWLVKCVFLLWLYLPFTRGAESLYTNDIRPCFMAYFNPDQSMPMASTQTEEATVRPPSEGEAPPPPEGGAPPPPEGEAPPPEA